GWGLSLSLPADPGPHLLRYFYTAVSEPGPGLPQFTVVGYLDDQLFFHFDSEGKGAQPRAPWIQAEGPEYWDRQTWIAKGWQEPFNGNVRIAMEHYNQSGDEGPGCLHTFQYMYGCQLRADGSTGGFWQYGYDGRDFLSYDTRTPTWVAPSKEAEITKGKMEADRRLSQQQRDYLERKCVEWLQKYLGYGKETLQRRERPAVRVTGRDAPDGPTTLCCRAHGFYPRDIALSWLRKGESREQETWRGGVLPNGDGTYHAWATVELDPRERGLYRCHVEHESLAQPLVAVWEGGGTPGSQRELINEAGCDRGASLDPSPGRGVTVEPAWIPAWPGFNRGASLDPSLGRGVTVEPAWIPAWAGCDRGASLDPSLAGV
uniref:Ig-like domain-containing protein n=1 Tax=Gopherus evgoodei TaxID=1825980 RepID=A0A8C4Y843_9SAUR